MIFSRICGSDQDRFAQPVLRQNLPTPIPRTRNSVHKFLTPLVMAIPTQSRPPSYLSTSSERLHPPQPLDERAVDSDGTQHSWTNKLRRLDDLLDH